MSGFVTHPEAPGKETARQAAEDLAENLRSVYEEYAVRISENIRSRFEVVIEIPFRSEHRPWGEHDAE